MNTANHIDSINNEPVTMRKGIILAGGKGSRLFPMTQAVSKQLIPMEVLLISTPQDLPNFKRLLGDGSQWGLEISYAEQSEPEGLAQAFIIGEAFINGGPVCLILGDNFFYGQNIAKTFLSAIQKNKGATIFGSYVQDPERYGVVDFDESNNVISLEEKPLNPKSNYAIPGIYFYDEKVTELAKTLKPSERGELEITDLNRLYLERDALRVELLGRGTTWLDTGTPDSLADATQFVQVIQQRQGLKIACLEEIAFAQGRINRKQLNELIKYYTGTEYAKYLSTL